MAGATKHSPKLRRGHVHQVLQPGVIPQILDGEFGPRLAHHLALDALLCWLVCPEVPTAQDASAWRQDG